MKSIVSIFVALAAVSGIAAAAPAAAPEGPMPKFSVCQVTLLALPQYNAVWGCPQPQELENCGGTEKMARVDSWVTRDNRVTWINGSPFHYATYVNLQGQLQQGWIAGIYMSNCSPYHPGQQQQEQEQVYQPPVVAEELEQPPQLQPEGTTSWFVKPVAWLRAGGPWKKWYGPQ